MKDLILMNLTMSSLEIATLTGKNHFDVLRDIRRMLKEIGVGESKFAFSYKSKQNKEVLYYNLPRDETLCLISGYAAKLRMAIIKRWGELEESNQRNYIAWNKARTEGKLARAEVTDTIKDFITYAESQGSRNAHFYYANISKGTYKALFMLEQGGRWKGAREYLTTFQLNQLATAEYLAQKKIAECMDAGTHYKDIYKIAIGEVEKLAVLLGKSQVTYCNHTYLGEIK